MKENQDSAVYAIRNNNNGKIYIGSTHDLQRRLTKHFSLLGHQAHPNEEMQRDFDVGGGNFSVATLFNGDFNEAVLLIEKLYMTLFQTRNSDSGYNSTDPSNNITVETIPFKPYNQQVKQISHHPDTFREWMFDARMSKKLTQKQIAEQLGISEGYYSYVENGTRQKHLDLLLVAKLSKIFDIPIERIVEMEERDS